MDRLTLEQHGIFRLEQIDDANVNVRRRLHVRLAGGGTKSTMTNHYGESEQVRMLRELLLDRKNILPMFVKKYVPPAELNDFADDVWFEEQRQFVSPQEQAVVEDQWQKRMQEASDIANRAHALTVEHYRENQWQSFYEASIFRQYRDDGKSSKSQRRDPLLDSYEMTSNNLWNHPALRRPSTDGASRLSDPKPDIYFAHPVHRTNSALYRGMNRCDTIAQFSYRNMKALVQDGYICTPTTGLAKSFNAKAMHKEDLMAFPFAVVELKHGEVNDSQRDFCFCQAANGISRSLTILENLYKREHGIPVPPVIAFTGIGSAIRVWTGDSVPGPGLETTHVMVCVAEMDVSTMWGVLEVDYTIQNMLRWATRVIRPSISAQISVLGVNARIAGTVAHIYEEQINSMMTKADERSAANGALRGELEDLQLIKESLQAQNRTLLTDNHAAEESLQALQEVVTGHKEKVSEIELSRDAVERELGLCRSFNFKLLDTIALLHEEKSDLQAKLRSSNELRTGPNSI
ncbi:hypothetical protein LTR86_010273 [Recurvomyces mirabilis]|nr:hypothetical protein LTR86_010273 [Recurvomyces mirabilis]